MRAVDPGFRLAYLTGVKVDAAIEHMMRPRSGMGLLLS